jgi:hypothetical protein
MISDLQVMLNALHKEREDLHNQLMQIDRIINRMKETNYIEDKREPASIEIEDRLRVAPISHAPDRTKITILKVFDIVGQACRLRHLQDEYNKIAGNKYNIREGVRGLQRQGLVKMIRDKDGSRGIYWIKREWIENDRLMDIYKPEGFDWLYEPDNIIFE